MREHWRDPQSWRWWWHYSASFEAQSAVVVLGVVAIAFGGFGAAYGLGALVGASDAGAFEATVERVVTMRDVARPRGGAEPAAREDAGRAGGASVRLVTTSLVRSVPVVRHVVVTRGDRPETVTRTTSRVVTVPARDVVTVPVRETVTVRRTATDERVVERVVTTERVVTVERPVTHVETSVLTQTVTVPLLDVRPVTVTQIVTVPEITTITITRP